MAAGWSTEETRTFLGIWGAADVQTQLDGIVRNQTIYGKIAAEMCDAGYERTWKQCKTKRNNMVQRYRKVRRLKPYICIYSIYSRGETTTVPFVLIR